MKNDCFGPNSYVHSWCVNMSVWATSVTQRFHYTRQRSSTLRVYLKLNLILTLVHHFDCSSALSVAGAGALFDKLSIGQRLVVASSNSKLFDVLFTLQITHQCRSPILWSVKARERATSCGLVARLQDGSLELSTRQDPLQAKNLWPYVSVDIFGLVCLSVLFHVYCFAL